MKINPFLKTLWNLFLLLLCIVIFLTYPFYGIISAVFVCILVYWRKRTPVKKPAEKPLLSDFITEYGSPEEHIVTNPTKGNEIDGAILYYRRLGFLVINGCVINKTDIQGMSLKNVENPYLPCDYEICVETSLEDCPTLFVSVGSDINWAGDVVRQLQVALSER